VFIGLVAHSGSMFYLTFLAQLSLLAQLPIYKSEIKSGITSIQSRYDESICTGFEES
jgi:hypothetical protein